MDNPNSSLYFQDYLNSLYFPEKQNEITFKQDITSYTKNVNGNNYGGPYKDLKKLLVKVEANESFSELIEDQIVKFFLNKMKLQEKAIKQKINWSPRLLNLWEMEKILANHNSPKELMKIRKEARELENAERLKHSEEMQRNITNSDILLRKLQTEEALDFWKLINKKMKKLDYIQRI